MARIRTIKPEFWSDDTLTECSLSARLLFIGTWNFADDDGNLDRSPKQIKARVFPVDAIDCEPLIQELLAHGLLIEYSVDGKKYLHIQGFTKHQVINRRSKPVVPPYEGSLTTQTTLTEPSLSTHAGREGKGREGSEQHSLSTHGASKRKAESKVNGFHLPAWVPEADWKAFTEMRDRARKPMTTRAKELIVAQLYKLRASGDDPSQVLLQSIRNTWADVYPLKPGAQASKPPKPHDPTLGAR